MLRAVTPGKPAQVFVSDAFTFIVPSSGSVAANGVITLTTALDLTYANAYCYFPAGVFTGSTAGFYYCTFSSTTAGQMYTNTYTSGVPAIPASPTAVSTGAGAYLQTTAADLAGQSFTIPGGSMGLNGRLYIEQSVTTAATAGTKTLKFNYAGNSLGQTTSAATGSNIWLGAVVNRGSASAQTTFSFNTGVTNTGSRTTNSAADQTLQAVYKIAADTDWIVSRHIFVELTNY